MKYDIIGDIHGHFHTLESLLIKLGYTCADGLWGHEGRRALFLGDYIDRGPMPRHTLELVRGMVDAGHAHALMENHELNAVAYHTYNAAGEPLRQHTRENTHQHRATLDAFLGRPDEWAGWLEWFKGLPFFFKEPGIRAVHACWCEASVARVRAHSLHNPQFLLNATEIETEECDALEMLLKGPELDISRFGLSVDLPGGRKRAELRVRWWGYEAPSYTLPDISMPPGANLPQIRVELSELDAVPKLPPGGTPVFFGHYKMRHQLPVAPLADRVCCLDYGAGSGGSLVAYRWDGERVLDSRKFVVQPEVEGGV